MLEEDVYLVLVEFFVGERDSLVEFSHVKLIVRVIVNRLEDLVYGEIGSTTLYGKAHLVQDVCCMYFGTAADQLFVGE
jgi:hypothetical protein